MEYPTITIVLLHGGVKHRKSNLVLEYIKTKKIIGLTKICVGNNKTKNRILNNKYNYTLEDFPCIIIKKDNAEPLFYPGTISNMVIMLEQLSNITDT